MRRTSLFVVLVAGVVMAAGCSGGESGSSTAGNGSSDAGTTGAASSSGSATSSGPTSAGTGSNKKITVVMIPKIKGIAYFNACEQGARDAAAKLPNVNLVYDGPTEASSPKQIALVESWIIRKPDVIAISCNGPDELAPSLRKAEQHGIHVITWDADANPQTSKREFYVSQADPKDVGYTLVDVMAQQAGPAADTLVITSTLSAPNQSEWFKYMQERQQQKYPQMKLEGPFESFEDQQKAFAATQNQLKAYPQAKGVFGISSTALPGAAEAVQKAGLTGKVAVTGLATPGPMKQYVESGVVKTVVLWNPVDLGALTVYTANAVATGQLKPGATSLDAGPLGKKEVEGDKVELGKLLQFTKENINQYNF